MRTRRRASVPGAISQLRMLLRQVGSSVAVMQELSTSLPQACDRLQGKPECMPLRFTVFPR
jgi:hypothetical protein